MLLAGCDPRLVRLLEDVVLTDDCVIQTGARSVEDETRAIASGHSKLTDPYDSKHVVGPQRPLALAVDAAPYPVVWPIAQPGNVWAARDLHALGRFYMFAGVVKTRARALGLSIRWGGDWDSDGDVFDQNFDDCDHFELVG